MMRQTPSSQQSQSVPPETVDGQDELADGIGRYRRLLAVPGSRALTAADLCARLPQGMLNLTLLLVVAQHTSMRVAGFALAGSSIGLAVTGPARGRFADRSGVLRAAVLCGGGYLAAWAGLLAASADRAAPSVLVVLATAVGCCTPPLSPAMRSLWSLHTPARLLSTAFALDAAVFDMAYIAGPVVASSLAVATAPAVALVVMLALLGAAVAVIAVRFRQRPAGGTSGMGRGLLRSAAVRRLLITAALTNLALSAAEVALIATVRLHHELWASGPLLAELSAGSILGSLLLGSRAPAARAQRRLARLLASFTLGLAALAAAALVPPLLALAAPLAGLCLGPTLATFFTMTASAAPSHNATEAQAWLNSMMNGGAAAGAALAGLTASQPILGLAAAAAAAGIAALTVSLGRAGNNSGPPRSLG
jgi:MFS family permease